MQNPTDLNQTISVISISPLQLIYLLLNFSLKIRLTLVQK